MKQADLIDPAATLVVWDAGAAVPGLGPAPNTTKLRHNGADHFLFADGHVRSQTDALSARLDATD